MSETLKAQETPDRAKGEVLRNAARGCEKAGGSPSGRRRIAAVVVTFHPDLAVLKAILAALREQVLACLLVDNTPDRDEAGRAEDLASQFSAHHHWMGTNRGLGAAHNYGFRWAEGNNMSHVLLLDQDSVPHPAMVTALWDGLKRAQSGGVPVAAVGPRYLDPRSGHASFFVQLGRWGHRRVRCDDQPAAALVPVDFLVSSGSLIPLDALHEVGLMDEALFIDHIDTEWCLRADSLGFRIYGVCEASMSHTLGDHTYRIWLGRWRYLPDHSPLRHYYIFRNSVLLYRRPYSPPRWIYFDLKRLMLMLLFYNLAAPARGRRLAMMLKGIWHGLRGRAGSLPVP